MLLLGDATTALVCIVPNVLQHLCRHASCVLSITAVCRQWTPCAMLCSAPPRLALMCSVGLSCHTCRLTEGAVLCCAPLCSALCECVVMPAGSQRVLSTSRDDSLRVWDAKKNLAQLSSFHHYNNTGRWVVPFRAVWGAASDTIICGSMKRTVSPS